MIIRVLLIRQELVLAFLSVDSVDTETLHLSRGNCVVLYLRNLLSSLAKLVLYG